MSGFGMMRLIARWRELGREHRDAFAMSLEDQIHEALLGCLAALVVMIDVILLAIAGDWL